MSTACLFDRGVLDPAPAQTLTFEMARQPDGSLAYCNESGCENIDNPGQCAILQMRIDMGTGHACERCLAADGQTKSETCEGTLLACAVITAPEPDCVVCAQQGGSVVYSSCSPEGPLDCVYYGADGGTFAATPGQGNSGCVSDADCAPGDVCVASDNPSLGTMCLPNCRICYDAGGRPVLSECAAACASVVCPAIACADGFLLVTPPGECCPQCVATTVCENTVCSQEGTLPSCPPGTDLVRDPLDCCHYTCQPVDCSAAGALADSTCPLGYAWVVDYPTCGRCVLLDNSAVCKLDGDCPLGEFCTTSVGDCQAGPSCASGSVCDQCWGVCRPANHTCASSAPLLPAACGGTWVSPGADQYGCPLPPVCECPGGVIATDGICLDPCAAVACLQAAPVCAAGETLSYAYPYCCGACVPSGTCGAMTGNVCPAIACGAGYHTETGLDCCPTCVRDSSQCLSTSECVSGEHCSTVDNLCTPTVSGCVGTCVPDQRCDDSDGLDPYTLGAVVSVAWGMRVEKADHCETPQRVIEMWCYATTAGGPSSTYGFVAFDCPYGCDAGRCLPPPPGPLPGP